MNQSNGLMNALVFSVFGIASLWDGFTTVYGTYQLLGGGTPALVASLVLGLLILSFLLNTSAILKDERIDFINSLMKLLWFLAVIYDLYTSWFGNAEFIVSRSLGEAQIVLLIGLTILVSGSPIMLSSLFDRRNDA